MAKAIREADGKALLSKYFKKLTADNGVGKGLVLPFKSATVRLNTELSALVKDHLWLETEVTHFYGGNGKHCCSYL